MTPTPCQKRVSPVPVYSDKRVDDTAITGEITEPFLLAPLNHYPKFVQTGSGVLNSRRVNNMRRRFKALKQNALEI